MERWVENPDRPYFTGSDVMKHGPPCDPSDGRPIRKRIGEKGIQKKSLLIRSRGIKKKSKSHRWSDRIPRYKATTGPCRPMPSGTKRSSTKATKSPKKKRSHRDRPMPRPPKNGCVKPFTGSLLDEPKKLKRPRRNSSPSPADQCGNEHENDPLSNGAHTKKRSNGTNE